MGTEISGLDTVDYIIFAGYVLVVIIIALLASRNNTGSTDGYFLAGKNIPWWAVGILSSRLIFLQSSLSACQALALS